MATVRFDTLDYARKLERAGVPAEQAALQAKALNDALAETGDLREQLLRLEIKVDRGFADVGARFEKMAAHSDARFDHVETKLSARIDALDLKLSGKIATLQWMFGTIIALIAAIFIQSLFRL